VAAGGMLSAPALLLLLPLAAAHTWPAAARSCCFQAGQVGCCAAWLHLLLLLLLLLLRVRQVLALPRPCCSTQTSSCVRGVVWGQRGCAAASLARTWVPAGGLWGLHGRIVTTVHMRAALPGRSAGR
jgi:hypothetical protein